MRALEQLRVEWDQLPGSANTLWKCNATTGGIARLEVLGPVSACLAALRAFIDYLEAGGQ